MLTLTLSLEPLHLLSSLDLACEGFLVVPQPALV